MDLSNFTTSLSDTLGAHLPNIAGALAILIVGWIIAVVARAVVKRLLAMLKVNQHIQDSTKQTVNVEGGIATALFWVILLVTILGVFNALDLEIASNPLQALANQIFGYMPRLLAGTILVLIAWLLAMVLRSIATKVLEKTTWDEKLTATAGMEPMSKNVGNVLFWLVILLFFPAILGAYALDGLLEPVQSMLAKLLNMLPNVLAAVVIGFVGWLVAKILGALVGNLLATAGADAAGHKAGLDESVKISRAAGTLVFIFIFIPTLIAALDALKIEAISEPATVMLGRILDAIPHVVAAAMILTITWFVAKFASGIVARLLSSIGLDTVPAKIGLASTFGGEFKPSTLVGMLIMFFAMLFATVEAANQLQFSQVSDVITAFITFGGDVLLGAVILLIGFWLANIAHSAIVHTGGGTNTALAGIVRIAILGLVIAMGLRAMGIADDIVNLAFGLTLGAVAVAVALSFGLGGREAAGKQMEHWLSKLRKD